MTPDKRATLLKAAAWASGVLVTLIATWLLVRGFISASDWLMAIVGAK